MEIRNEEEVTRVKLYSEETLGMNKEVEGRRGLCCME